MNRPHIDDIGRSEHLQTDDNDYQAFKSEYVSIRLMGNFETLWEKCSFRDKI